MDTKKCTMCNIEKHINSFYRKYSECRDCNRTRGVNDIMKIKIKYQINKKYIMKKNRGRILLQKQNNR